MLQLSDGSKSDYGAYKDDRAKGLISASQVNRLWRSIALSVTSVWAEVYDPRDPSLQRFQEIHRRTGQAPLRLTGLVPVKTHVWEVEAIDGLMTEHYGNRTMDTLQWRYYLDETSRFKEIDITFRAQRGLESTTFLLLADALKAPAPLLERLSLDIEAYPPAGFFYDSSGKTNGQNVIFGSQWFSGNAPRLRHLTMRNIFLDVNMDTLNAGLMGGFDNLISFEVDCPGGVTFPFIGAWWIYLTRFTTFNPGSRLEHIDIGYIDTYAYRHRPIDESGSPGALPPSLKSFRLQGSIIPCVWMLGDISEIPHSCRVIDLEFEVDVRLMHFDGTDSRLEHEQVLRDLMTHFSAAWMNEDCSELSLAISMSKFLLKFVSDSGRRISLTISPIHDPNWTSELAGVRLFSDALDSIARQQSFPCGITSETWLKLSIVCEGDSVNVLVKSLFAFLGRFPGLRNLHLVQFPLAPFRATLCRPLFCPTNVPEPATVLNFLKVENVKDVVFPLVDRIRLDDRFFHSRWFIDAMNTFLEERVRSGNPVQVVERVNNDISTLAAIPLVRARPQVVLF
ncbi:hypothetical protein EST38_g4889 [Candolleomyces aberdarensis]|uniref:Uncharacterized protein n=1 Tax=Candolleomyces aberdarensis TaxID=2316362 RepID=A0A4V1Q461_9AGAR|nr:hypothetical protein EST38_g4889 [Candolleomyces aberdarensis]